MASNNVDVLVRLRSEITGFAGSLGAIFTLKALISNIEEAQNSAAQLDAAFRATGQGLGLTRERLDDLAATIQNTTTFSDDLVGTAESILLTFTKVRGEAFERTTLAATDLAARLGIDLVGATRLLGKALQDPETGLARLRSKGIDFSEAQKDLIENFIRLGQTANAQDVILDEVEKRFKGSAEAARNTLGGALEALGNSFGNLFESSTRGTAGAVDSINKLSLAFNDPKLKEGIDLLIGALASVLKASTSLATFVVSNFGKIGDAIGEATAKAMGFVGINEEINTLIKTRENIFAQIEKRKGGGLFGFLQGDNDKFIESLKNDVAKIDAQIKVLREVFKQGAFKDPKTLSKSEDSNPLIQNDSAEAVERVTEIIIKDMEIRVDANQKLLDDFNENTRTAGEKEIADFREKQAELTELRRLGIIDAEEFNNRLGEAQDKLLPEIDIGAISSQLKTVGEKASETALIVKGAFEQAGASIQSTLSEAIQSGKLSFKSLVDVARKAVADILAAIIVSGIKKAIASQLSTSSGGGKNSGVVAGILGAFVGNKASGGLTSGAFIAGEEGPELINLKGGSAQVFNKRQLQFAGAGNAGGLFAPVTNIQIIEREDPEQTKREIFQVVAIQNAKNEEKFMQRLARNGMPLR